MDIGKKLYIIRIHVFASILNLYQNQTQLSFGELEKINCREKSPVNFISYSQGSEVLL
ncbi:hypothetical protein DSECCO2_160880 [anaerobic digester metagenome]